MLKKCVKAAKSDGKNWRKEMHAFLRNYRTSPHATTGVAPSTLFLKRAVRNKLPQRAGADQVAEIVYKRDTDQKWKMKCHADRKNYHKPCDLSIGESVLVKRPFTASKSHTPYESNPMTIVTRKGSMISAKTDQGRSVTDTHQTLAPPRSDAYICVRACVRACVRVWCGWVYIYIYIYNDYY